MMDKATTTSTLIAAPKPYLRKFYLSFVFNVLFFFCFVLFFCLGFAAQFLFASWGGLNQPGHAVPVLVINGLPAVLGAAWFFASG